MITALCTQPRDWVRIETYYKRLISNVSQLHPTNRLGEN